MFGIRVKVLLKVNGDWNNEELTFDLNKKAIKNSQQL